MLVSQLTKLTLDIQGFRVGRIQGDTSRITVDIVPDRRNLFFCSRCGSAAKYRDTLTNRYFRHVPLWGIPVWLRCRPREFGAGIAGSELSIFPGALTNIGSQRFLPTSLLRGPGYCLGNMWRSFLVAPGAP
jgi:hypothetical protein